MQEQTPSQTNKQRTDLQNRALHKYCTQVAEKCREGGISYKLLLESVEITPTMETIKELFRLIGGAKFRKWSTADFTTKELMETFDEVNAILALKGVHIPWPSNEYNFLND